jgi:RimJ/RimL family protein N-acetyltransferase
MQPADRPVPRLRITIGGAELRQFAVNDMQDLYLVRNHESVRSFMADPREIAWESHVTWVNANLIPGRDILLFLARLKGETIGLTLLKRLAPDRVEAGVMFREASLHPVIPAQAAVAMLYLAFEYFQVGSAVSYVLPGHRRALALNRGLGGPEVESDKPGMVCFRSSRDSVLRNRRYRALMARIGPKMTIVTE